MSGFVDISFKCPNCGSIIELKGYELNEPNWFAEHSRDEMVESDGVANCLHCRKEFNLYVFNDFSDVYLTIEGDEPEELIVENLSYEDEEDDYDEYVNQVSDSIEIQGFVDAFLRIVKKDFVVFLNGRKKDGVRLCDVNIDFRGNVQYDRKEIQQYYFLRYFYAYFLEYHYIYKMTRLSNYNVLSIGCGPYVDLISLYYAVGKNENRIKYFGIDPVDWEYKASFENAFSCSYCHGTLDEYLGMFDIGEHNVFIFPKSMEYLDLTFLKEKIRKTNFRENVIYLILNGMDSKSDLDERKFDSLKDVFRRIGYVKTEERKKNEGFVERFEELPENIKYSDCHWLKELSKYCVHGTICQDEDCPLNRYPILKTKSFNYKIYRLEKYDY